MKPSYFQHQKTDTTHSTTKQTPSIEFLSNQLDLLNIRHQHQMQHINHKADRIEYLLANIEQQPTKVLEKKADKIEYRLLGMLQEEKQEFMRRQAALRKFVEYKAVTVEQIIAEQLKQDQELTEQVNQLIASKVSALKSMLSEPKEYMKTKSSSQKRNRSDVKSKVAAGLQALNRELISIKKSNQNMNKEAGKLTRAYLKNLGEIEQGKQDREAKEEQLLIKIQELSGGDRTKEETMSRIQ